MYKKNDLKYNRNFFSLSLLRRQESNSRQMYFLIWIPASAGMTTKDAGMTTQGAEKTSLCAGMTLY
jgi:hypothetical protein